MTLTSITQSTPKYTIKSLIIILIMFYNVSLLVNVVNGQVPDYKTKETLRN